ncbi:protein-N(pi)-phosphohistidine--sugar phosphotransferase [Rhizobium sp. Root1203]|uniref:PTS sugar transporter subunit IIA n=1 Tax=Rhizobium sp. Root1203 TaxID=1736427 RepID=UPI00070FE027|nr:PTS sugar transporter subunit IIA [Rhizobium sp. Root1203]KQV12295.1 protein-N(pi)-phosphohistidine--sugar phosphotransferase [Rhizobium sp. Root1203]
MNLSAVIRPDHTFVGVGAATKWRGLQAIAEKAAEAFEIDPKIILRALESRERLGSTGIGNGVAVPHAVVLGMTHPRGLLIRFARPLDFEAVDDVPTDIAFVLLFGENHRGEYLNVLAAIARQLQSPGIVASMRKAKTAEELYSDFLADSRVL